MGPPSDICFSNNGTTDPEDPNTFPNLTAEKKEFSLLIASLRIFFSNLLRIYPNRNSYCQNLKREYFY